RNRPGRQSLPPRRPTGRNGMGVDIVRPSLASLPRHTRGFPLLALVVIMIEVERGGQVADRRLRITRGQRRGGAPALDELEDGDRLILVTIDAPLPDEGGDEDARDADTHAPPIGTHWRHHVVPTATILIIRNNDDAVLPDRAVLHRLDEIGDVLLAGDD